MNEPRDGGIGKGRERECVRTSTLEEFTKFEKNSLKNTLKTLTTFFINIYESFVNFIFCHKNDI